MKAHKKKKLERAGFKVGSAKELLNLTDEQSVLIEMRLALGHTLAQRRKQLGYTQARLAKAIGSSQSRVAKMEAGDVSVSVDLLIRSSLQLGISPARLGRTIGSVKSAA